MGQVSDKIHTVCPGSRTNTSNRVYGSIQEAIDYADCGSIIILNSGDHFGHNKGPINMKSHLHFYAMHDANICAPLNGEHSDIIFDNVVFKNCDNESLLFRGKGYLFRSCEFHIRMKGCSEKVKRNDVRFGFHLAGGSALLQNPIFCVDIEDMEVFVIIGADCAATYLSLQSPIIRVKYENVCKIETYFFRGVSKMYTIPYFEAFSTSAHFRTEDYCFEYDGHCCRSKCEKKHCCKKSCKCKRSHGCCEVKCKRTSRLAASIRLFRGIDCVNTSIMSTKMYFINGDGCFNIAAGDTAVYINGLSAIASDNRRWEVNEFRNIYLSSFMSNLKNACNVKDYRFPKEDCKEDCTEESDYSRCDESCDDGCDVPCIQPCPIPVPCASPIAPCLPCASPCGPNPCCPSPCPSIPPCNPCIPNELCLPLIENPCPPKCPCGDSPCTHTAPLNPCSPCNPCNSNPTVCLPICVKPPSCGQSNICLPGNCNPPLAKPSTIFFPATPKACAVPIPRFRMRCPSREPARHRNKNYHRDGGYDSDDAVYY